MMHTFFRSRFLILVLVTLSMVGVSQADTVVTLQRADFAGITFNLSNPPATFQRRTEGDIFSKNPDIGAALTEYSLAGLNAEGIFAARFTGRVSTKLEDPAGNRQVSVNYYEGNGVINQADINSPPVRDPGRVYPSYSFDSTTPGFVDVNMDVTRELREAVRRGTTHIGAVVQSTLGQGTSTINSAAPPVMEITEYFANPLSAVPVIVGQTGLAFRGQADEFISQGTSQTLTPADWNFQVNRNFDNGISVVALAKVGLTRWDLNLAAPGDALLQIGNTFNATRFPFQMPTTGGFNFSGDSRGNNELVATFTINDVLYEPDGTVTRLDVQFSQRSLDTDVIGQPVFGKPSVFGQFKFNAVAVPEPGSLLSLGVIGGGLFIGIRQRRNRWRSI